MVPPRAAKGTIFGNFEAQGRPFGRPRGPKRPPKLIKKTMKKNIDFCIDFYQVLEPKMEPKSTQTVYKIKGFRDKAEHDRTSIFTYKIKVFGCPRARKFNQKAYENPVLS